MLKRTTGRLLLTLLVITGLAGTVNDSSLSKKERKQAIGLFKASKVEILNSINGLSPAQLNFRTASDQPSINELLAGLIAFEKKCNQEIKAVMARPSNSEKRLKIELTDNQLLARNNFQIPHQAEEKLSTNPDTEELIRQYNILRTQHIKYIRTSTQDLRNHIIPTSLGWLDCYQYYLLMADKSLHVAEKIRSIRESAAFPKK